MNTGKNVTTGNISLWLQISSVELENEIQVCLKCV